ncbi:MAG: hypothetical protein K9G62_02310 [Alphaproteobacteria bacterium]|nr:hypothetical protein [Alphaproteobacteria bacterium]
MDVNSLVYPMFVKTNHDLPPLSEEEVVEFSANYFFGKENTLNKVENRRPDHIGLVVSELSDNFNQVRLGYGTFGAFRKDECQPISLGEWKTEWDKMGDRDRLSFGKPVRGIMSVLYRTELFG